MYLLLRCCTSCIILYYIQIQFFLGGEGGAVSLFPISTNFGLAKLQPQAN